jgi:hypothetical protein
VKPPYDYIHQGASYRYGVGWARIRIYAGESSSDAPVVLCSELPENAGEGMVERLAAEVVRDRFGDGLPDLPRPLLWIEHVPPRRKGPGKYFLLTFPTYIPRSEGAGFVRRFTLGSPSRERLTPREVEVLTGEEL